MSEPDVKQSARIVSVRESYDYQATWACLRCGIGDAAFVQPRCPRCLTLMVKVDR